MDELSSLKLESLNKLYSLVDESKAEEIRAGHGIKKARTALRVKLLQISKLCKQARSEIMRSKQQGGTMDKYGVDEGVELVEKTAVDCLAEQCPACGAACTRHGAVLLCPVCGSKPFEEVPVKQEKGA
jgi:ribosomal protein S27AE